MADTAKPAAKAEAKSEAKSDVKSESKDKTSTDSGSGKETESKSSDAPAGYSRGENQKLVTDTYRKNWNAIFGKKPRGGAKR